jgi:hypothetical protein
LISLSRWQTLLDFKPAIAAGTARFLTPVNTSNTPYSGMRRRREIAPN